MRVTFLGHSGFYLELPEADLLFDYFIGNLPVLKPGRTMFVFVSHIHQDHFSREIYRLAERVPEGAQLIYVFSDDIPAAVLPEEVRRFSFRTGPGNEFLIPVRTVPAGVYLTVRTFASTDEGVAFLADLGAVRIYHAGDLNRWHWEEENEEDRLFNEDQRKRYAFQLSRIAAVVQKDGHVPDCAFVPLDNRLGEAGCYLGLEEYMDKVGAGNIFPMHLFGDPGIIGRMKAREKAVSYKDRILGTGTPGESFVLPDPVP